MQDAATLDAMPIDERNQHLGMALYPTIMTLTGEALAGKITGMLLEMTTKELLDLLASHDLLKAQVGAAIDALPPDLLDLLGEPAATAEVQSPGPSPTSITATNLTGGWADADDEDEEMPCVSDLFAAGDAKRAAKAEQLRIQEAARVASGYAAPMEEEIHDGFVCAWDAAQWCAEPAEKLCVFVAERLEEPQVRIVRAVVETLGPEVALSLLLRTERCMHRGGMVVEETGKSRTKGGIYVKLLKDATDLNAEMQAAALMRMKKEGDDAKKAQRKALAAKRSAAAGKPAVESSPERAQRTGVFERPKPLLADFIKA